MVPAIAPSRQALDAKPHVLDVLSRELVPVQRVNGQDEQTGPRRVCGVEARLLDGRQDLLVGLGNLVPSLWRVDVNPEAELAARKVEAGFHAAAFVLVDVVADGTTFSRRGVLVMELRAVLLDTQTQTVRTTERTT